MKLPNDKKRPARSEYPFLQAALRDFAFAYQIASQEPGREAVPRYSPAFKAASPRHVVSLLHDAIEFMLYEILLAHDVDVYKSGQQTIGLDQALAEYRKLGFEMPFIGVFRSLQKHRGDAKHHAQLPDPESYERMLAGARRLVSRLVHEHFRELVKEEPPVSLMPHHEVLFDRYRRYRNHNWERAAHHAVVALIEKHVEVFGPVGTRLPSVRARLNESIEVLTEEIGGSDYSVAPAAQAARLAETPVAIGTLVKSEDFRAIAEAAARGYSLIDEVAPSTFDLREANRLTPRLVQPRRFRPAGPMSWAKAWRGADTPEGRTAQAIHDFLAERRELVRILGEPFDMEDDERFWRWWELAVFDGERWQSFHLSDRLEVSLEAGVPANPVKQDREKTLGIILAELEAAATAAERDKSR